ncbi:hypothetical protein P5673_026869 [Acropora cervicornis]|uniref:Uncharacterized protein n=1 Tax=Acropora cervicornis TaxID=6130 RepID=A0AAD9Q009_ACRCE|nr:hypothetical protein P5673_026869 [Acropora cervicornis]
MSTIENATQASSSFDAKTSSTIVSASINAPSTSKFSNNVKPVAAEEMLETLKTCFPDLTLRSSYNCQNNCINLSPSELRSQKQLKIKFNHNWLFGDFTYCKQTDIHWLIFGVQSHGMFCVRNMPLNLRNKAKAYSSEPATRFRKLALEEHAASKQHHAAIAAEILSRVFVFHQEYVNQEVKFLFIEDVLNDQEADGATADMLLKVLTKPSYDNCGNSSKIHRRRAQNAAKKKVLTEVQKSCRTRWLSLDRSVEGVYLGFVPLMQTLQHFSEADAVAAGLLSKMRTPKFIGAIYALNQVLPVLTTLSKTFQKGTINFAQITSAIKATQSALDRIVEANTAITQMQADLAEDGRLSLCGANPIPNQCREVTNLLIKYVQSLKQNIRFQAALPVVLSFSVFDPLAVPAPQDASFRGYGLDEVEILGAHYYVTQTDKEKLQAERNNFKFELVQWKSKDEFKTATTMTTPTERVLHHLITMKETYTQVYPMLYRIVEVCTTMLVLNAWPERGVQTADQEDVTVGNSDDKAEDTTSVSEEPAVEAAVSEDVLESLNLCPDDDSNVDSDSDYACDFD